jgi:YVTN family beta-propeller protein
LDPQTVTVRRTVPIVGTGLTFDGTSLWVIGPDGLSQLDPETGAQRHRYPLPVAAADVLFAGGRLWLSDPDHGVVEAVDPRTGAVTARVAVGRLPESLTYDGSTVWVSNGRDNTISQIDPGTVRVIRTVRLGETPVEPWGPTPTTIAAVGDRLWAVTYRTLMQDWWDAIAVDVHSGKIVKVVSNVPGPAYRIATDGHDLWLAEGVTSSAATRIDSTTGQVSTTR